MGVALAAAVVWAVGWGPGDVSGVAIALAGLYAGADATRTRTSVPRNALKARGLKRKLGQAVAVWILATSLIVVGVVGFVLGGLPGKLLHSLGLGLFGGSLGALAAGSALWQWALRSDDVAARRVRVGALARVGPEEEHALAELEAELHLDEPSPSPMVHPYK